MNYTGILYDATNSQPIANATVTLYNGSTIVARALTNAGGSFIVESTAPGDKLEISSVGFKTATFTTNNYQRSFYLERDYKELDPVVLNNKKNRLLPWLLIGGLVYLISRNGK